ncbi:MAG: hypothetical protein AAGG44_19770, partial [Planctomycetota bacterium]
RFARDCLAKRYREAVPISAVSQLQSTLEAQFPGNIETIEFLRAEYNHASALTSGALSKPRGAIYHLVRFDDGAQALSESIFQFTSSRRDVGLGLLSSVQVKPTWPWAAPEQAQAVLAFLNRLRLGTLKREDFAAPVQRLIDVDDINRSFQQVKPLLAAKPLSKADLTTWAAAVDSSHGIVRGMLDTVTGDSAISIAMEGNEVVGIRLRNEAAQWSSLARLNNAASIGDAGNLFWELLIEGDYPGAHKMMSRDFQRSLPLEKLRELVEQSKFYEPAQLEEVVWDQSVVATRLDRPSDRNISSYHLLRFRGDIYQPVRCEYRLVDASLELVDFGTDFVEQLVVPPNRELVESLLVALNADDEKVLLAFVRSSFANRIERPILRNFLRHCRSKLGRIQLKEDARISAQHDYEIGRRFERYELIVQGDPSTGNSLEAPVVSQSETKEAVAVDESATSIPVRATFEDNQLTMLQFETDRLAGALAGATPDLLEHLRMRAQTLTESWIRVGTAQLGSRLRLIGIHDEKERERRVTNLDQLRGSWLVSLGDLESVTVAQLNLLPDQETATCTANCKFAGGETSLRLQLGIDAFGTFIESLESVSPE